MLLQTGGRKGWRGRAREREKRSEWGSSSAAESLVSLHGCKGYVQPRLASVKEELCVERGNLRLSARVGESAVRSRGRGQRSGLCPAREREREY